MFEMHNGQKKLFTSLQLFTNLLIVRSYYSNCFCNFSRIRKLIMERCFVKSEDDMKNRSAWEKDYILTPPGQRQLFYEYLEMCRLYRIVDTIQCHLWRQRY